MDVEPAGEGEVPRLDQAQVKALLRSPIFQEGFEVFGSAELIASGIDPMEVTGQLLQDMQNPKPED